MYLEKSAAKKKHKKPHINVVYKFLQELPRLDTFLLEANFSTFFTKFHLLRKKLCNYILILFFD